MFELKNQIHVTIALGTLSILAGIFGPCIDRYLPRRSRPDSGMKYFTGGRGHNFCICRNRFVDIEAGFEGNAIMPA